METRDLVKRIRTKSSVLGLMKKRLAKEKSSGKPTDTTQGLITDLEHDITEIRQKLETRRRDAIKAREGSERR